MGVYILSFSNVKKATHILSAVASRCFIQVYKFRLCVSCWTKGKHKFLCLSDLEREGYLINYRINENL